LAGAEASGWPRRYKADSLGKSEIGSEDQQDNGLTRSIFSPSILRL
jgi:hypothetical protein